MTQAQWQLTDTELFVLALDLERDHSSLMDKLVEIRASRMSQQDVARELSVSQPTISQFESEESNPTLATIRRYALAVGARIRTTVEVVEAMQLPEKVSEYRVLPTPLMDNTDVDASNGSVWSESHSSARWLVSV